MSNDLIPVADIEKMAHAVAKSGLFGVKTQEQAFALMLVAQSENMHPAAAARDYNIIAGKAAKTSEAMLRDFLKSGGLVKWHALSDTSADATFSHPQGGEVRITWDMRRADVAGLKGKEMYKKFPRQMLRARCVSEGVRTVCPMATGGMYTPEEVQDMPPKDIGSGTTIEGTAGQVDYLPEEQLNAFLAAIEKSADPPAAKAVYQQAVAACKPLGDVASANAVKDALMKKFSPKKPAEKPAEVVDDAFVKEMEAAEAQ